MPLYEYECTNGHKFESFSSIDDRLNILCPECGSSAHIRFSKLSMRVAQPIRWLTSAGKEIGWKADGGMSPLPGQPYPVGGR